MTGHIRRRGVRSWELKFDLGTDALTGKRQIRYETVKGTKKDAERHLATLLHTRDNGTIVDHNKVTVGEYIRDWLNTLTLAGKTTERYREIINLQIAPHLGHIQLQKLKRGDVMRWHQLILKGGASNGAPLSATTVRQAHRILHKALSTAVDAETLARNVSARIKLPKNQTAEVEILSADQIDEVLKALEGHRLAAVASLAIGSGARRGELLGLQWGDIDLDGATIRIERSLEQTRAGLKLKTPKTKHGRRTISLAQATVDALRAHRRQQLEQRFALGLGAPAADTLVFALPDGAPWTPDLLSNQWRVVLAAKGLPKVVFHSLRHAHASALIAAGLDVVTVSRRLGHSSPTITLSIYAHRFKDTDKAAAAAIQAVLRR